MEERKIRWYGCRKDALLVAALVCGSFWLNPITQFYAWFRWKDDLGVGGMLAVLVVMLIVSMVLCKRHFWTWSVICVLGFYVTRHVSIYVNKPNEYYTFGDYMHDAVVNGLIFFMLMSPVLTLLYRLKKRYESRQEKE